MRRHLFAVGVLLLLLSTVLDAQDRTRRPLSREGLITATVPRRYQPPSPTATPAELEQHGDEYRSQKAYADAIDYYRAALSRDSEKSAQASLYNKIGIAELQLQHFKEAQKNFERSARLDSTRAEAYNNMGAALYLRRKYGKAIGEYKRALKLHETDASFHVNLGAAYFSDKQIPLAVTEYKRALELDPGILDRTSRTGVSAVFSAPEDHAQFFYMLARMYAQTGALDTSIHYLKKAIEDGYKGISNVYKDQEFSQLRKDPRFADLMSGKPTPLPE
jgi:tetratricopeptide (TPR) repeat protein